MTIIGSDIATSSYGSSSAAKASSGADFASLLEPGAADKDSAKIAEKTSVPEEVTFTHNGQTFTARRLNVELKPMSVAEMPEEQYQQFLSSMEMMLDYKYRSPPEPADLSNYAPVKSYANVTVNGKVVAKIDNQGCVETSNAVGARLQKMLEDYADVNGTNGPDLAQLRAEKIAALLGGKVEKSTTAMTQSAFNNYPPLEQPQARIDYAAMKRDPMYEQIQSLKEKRAAYLAKQAAGVTEAAA
ncbi:MAG TPA: hypothetical protein VGF14_05340 [Alphaproteobacteria bacterium]